MKTKKLYTLFALAVVFALPACSDFLDEMPDNRTELDTEDKIVSILVSAYPEAPYVFTCEFSSDNIDETSLALPDYLLEQEQLYRWQEVTESYNDSPTGVWGSCYGAIASANQALAAIEELGGPTTDKLKAAKGEALLCRAYAHFILVNIFCQAYNAQHAEQDLGIPYMEKAETTLDPKYPRGTVAEVYAKIKTDLEEGLPLINDEIYSVPKYHFNQKAAYGFASRFYLFYNMWDECIKAANKVLGSAPEAMMRDLAANGKFSIQSADLKTMLRTMDYIDYTHKCNLMMLAGYSEVGWYTYPYDNNNGFTFTNWIGNTETFRATTAPYGSGVTLNSPPYSSLSGSNDKLVAWRVPYLFEYTDPVNNIGRPHIVYPMITVEEVMLNRAEAYIMKKEYAPALEDMNRWVKGYVKAGASTMTEESIRKWGERTAYYKPEAPTVKKKFGDTGFTIEAGVQESMCQAVLFLRRVETVHLGLRFFDIKRYGITVDRRKLSSPTTLGSVTDQLVDRDPRCALQIPPEVVKAGMTPNPR